MNGGDLWLYIVWCWSILAWIVIVMLLRDPSDLG